MSLYSMFEYIHSLWKTFSRVPNLLWNEVFSETRCHLPALRRIGWLWIHSLFISRSKMFSRVPNLLWNEVFSETGGRLWTLQRRGWLWIHSLFISRSKTFSRVPNLLWNEVFSETRGHLWTIRLAFDFPDWNFFSLQTRDLLWTVRLARIKLLETYVRWHWCKLEGFNKNFLLIKFFVLCITQRWNFFNWT